MSRAWSVRLMTTGIYVLLLGIHYKLCYFHTKLPHVHCRLQSTSVICKRVTTGFLSVNFRSIIILILKVVSRGNLPIAMGEDATRYNNNDKKKKYLVEVIFFCATRETRAIRSGTLGTAVGVSFTCHICFRNL